MQFGTNKTLADVLRVIVFKTIFKKSTSRNILICSTKLHALYGIPAACVYGKLVIPALYGIQRFPPLLCGDCATT